MKEKKVIRYVMWFRQKISRERRFLSFDWPLMQKLQPLLNSMTMSGSNSFCFAFSLSLFISSQPIL